MALVTTMVVDASCLYELVIHGPMFRSIAAEIAATQELVAPHIVDVEVAGLIRRDLVIGLLDQTAADLAISRLSAWPGERVSHRPFHARVWELRNNVRSWDAFYVALAEALDAPLLTLDIRLSQATGPTCECRVPG